MSNATSHQAHTTGRSFRPGSGGPTTDVAVRLMSETAHDIRSPMTAIRESVRLVHDGDLGRVNEDQESMLAAAIDQCDCVDHMVNEMMQLDRLRNGMPRVQRSWTPLANVQQAIENTLRPWALPREITVAWESSEDPKTLVFVDPTALRRLVVNLVTNAIRVTRAGDRVLIRWQQVRNGEAIRWTIADRGVGISDGDLRQIASRQASTSGGEGLGLMISRQLAALHFSSLTIQSRPGEGTEVSFETPTGSPSAVAACWSRWRDRFSARPHFRSGAPGGFASRGEARGELAMIEKGTRQIRPPRRGRLKPTATQIEIDCDGQKPWFDDQIAIGTVTLGAAMAREAADQFDNVFQNQLRLFDFAYRVDNRRWVWLFDADENDANERIEAITNGASKMIANLRSDWSQPQSLPLKQRRTLAIVSDLLTRETLSASTLTNVQDTNQVRLGTPPIQRSRIASQRLEQEVKRLTDTRS